MTTCLIRIACWISWATKTYFGYVMIIAFPLQQWVHERASVLRCTYIASFIVIFGLLRQWHCHWGWLDIEQQI